MFLMVEGDLMTGFTFVGPFDDDREIPDYAKKLGIARYEVVLITSKDIYERVRSQRR